VRVVILIWVEGGVVANRGCLEKLVDVRSRSCRRSNLSGFK
jgi:hypothetical protein